MSKSVFSYKKSDQLEEIQLHSNFLCFSGNDYRLDSMWNTTDVSKNNSSNSTLQNIAEQNWEVMLLLPIVLFGLAGNILVCMAVSMEKRLQSVTNYFLLSLAMTDLLVCIIVMPFSMVNEFIGHWPFSHLLCDLYVTSDVLMCTSSILHLCTISLERYLAIRSPLHIRNRSKSIVILKIIFVWATALAITSPITILGFVDDTNVINDEHCALSNKDFIIYGSIGAFFIPLGIMVISYGLTIHLLYKQTEMCKTNNEGQPIIRRSISRKAHNFRKRVKFSTRQTNSCPQSHPEDSYSQDQYQNPRNDSINSCIGAFSMEESTITPPPSPMQLKTTAPDLDTITEESQSDTSFNWNDNNSSEVQTPIRLTNLVKKHQLVLKATSILLMKKYMRQRQQQDDVRTEQKASKVLGVVFVIFIVCWAPFFVVNIMTALCNKCEFQPLLITSFVWLGYVSSTLNPIIYTMFNRTFKMTFIKLLKCQYKAMQKSLRVRWRSSNGHAQWFTSAANTSDDQYETPL